MTEQPDTHEHGRTPSDRPWRLLQRVLWMAEMTEQPDTTVWRHLLDRGYGIDLSEGQGYALLDALDAARAERDIHAELSEMRQSSIGELMLISDRMARRAEAAEARIAAKDEQLGRFVARLHEAEARVAAALGQGHCVACVHQALTGGDQ